MGNAPAWKSGRGLLGPLKPLLGRWEAKAAGPGAASQMRCTRSFEPALGGGWIRLGARWEMGADRAYEELALFGKGEDGALSFFSFTSDGESSRGRLADGSDVHPQAIAFEAQMPAGLARMIYWPAEEEGFYFAVESSTKKGWNRFMRHHYRALDAEQASILRENIPLNRP
ncbi:MAG TPA: hypothetical protein VH331_04335 [Allosphingosinicella sp.]|jgi:hypothetical protein|nr:hypothetical protein [Allosphingosinicella sp.]